jgi:ABC-2 type transport system permease protein
MEMLTILWRNLKWRFQNPISIIITVIQPLIWLLLYSRVASGSMQTTGIGNYTAFILPGLIVLVTFAACCSGGMINYIMKSGGSFYRILIAPVRRSSIVLGQMLEAVVTSFIEVAILSIVSLFFSVTVASGVAGIGLMILLIFLTAFFMAGLAYAISLCLPNEAVYETIMNAIVLPVFFLSTALFPPESLQGGLKVAVMLNPLTHLINVLRQLFFGETIAFGEIMHVIILFVAMGGGVFALAMWRLRKELVH